MKMQTGEELLTVRDIAARISPTLTPESIAKTLRQVRHWTTNDLLQTVSEKILGAAFLASTQKTRPLR